MATRQTMDLHTMLQEECLESSKAGDFKEPWEDPAYLKTRSFAEGIPRSNKTKTDKARSVNITNIAKTMEGRQESPGGWPAVGSAFIPLALYGISTYKDGTQGHSQRRGVQ